MNKSEQSLKRMFSTSLPYRFAIKFEAWLRLGHIDIFLAVSTRIEYFLQFLFTRTEHDLKWKELLN